MTTPDLEGADPGEARESARPAPQPREMLALVFVLLGAVAAVAGAAAYDVRAGLITLGVSLLFVGYVLGLEA